MKRIILCPAWLDAQRALSRLSQLGAKSETYLVVPDPILKSLGPYDVRDLWSFSTDYDAELIHADVSRVVSVVSEYFNRRHLAQHKSLSLWEAARYYVGEMVADTLRKVNAYNRVVSIEKPSDILVVEDTERFRFWAYTDNTIILRLLHSKVGGSRQLMGDIAKKNGVSVAILTRGSSVRILQYVACHLLRPIVELSIRARAFQRKVEDRIRNGGSERTDAHKRTIVAFVRGSYQALTTVPVVKELRTRGYRTVVIAAESVLRNDAGRVLLAEGISFRNLEAYMTRHVLADRIRAAIRLGREWKVVKDDPSFRGLLDYHGIDLFPAIGETLRETFTSFLPEIAGYFEMVRGIFEREKPSVVLMMDDVTVLERAAASLAKLVGIPSVAVQYGAGPLSRTQPLMLLTTDLMAVSGEAAKSSLVKHRAIPPERLRVTGQPGFEYRLSKVKRAGYRDLSETLGLDPNKPIVVFASHALHPGLTAEARDRVLRAIYGAVERLGYVQLVVKLHPSEGTEHHQALVGHYALHTVRIVKHVDLYALLSSCDMLITAWESTTALEAMLLGKPVIMISHSTERETIPYVESGAALPATCEAELCQTIKLIIENGNVRTTMAEARRHFLDQMVHGLDGKSAARCADVIEELINNSEPESATNTTFSGVVSKHG